MHEVSRVFYDRLVDEEGREFFKELIEDSMKLKWRNDIKFSNVIFSNLLKLEDQDKLYEEITNMNSLNNTLHQYLDEFNVSSPNKMNLVFFSDAVNHICRIIRVLLQPRGNAMLIGVSGCGKQSLTRLASFMLTYQNYSIKLTKNYKPKDFREDLKKVLKQSGCHGTPYTFLMSDTQIVNETFLEDINNILNTGDITNLYDPDDMQIILEEIEPYTKKLGRALSQDVKYSTYIERLRDQFHIILCMSPVGDSLRIRCRMFPSLVNCCTLDWYDSWSEEALLDVSRDFIKEMEGIEDPVKDKLAHLCPFIYKSVEQTAVKFDEELRRKVYITPKSYLDSINMYKNFLDEKRQDLDVTIDRLSSGLSKLSATSDQVTILQDELTKLKPSLEKASEAATQNAKEVSAKKKESQSVEIEAAKEAKEVEKIAEGVKEVFDEVQEGIAQAKPAEEEAKAALEVLNPADINEVKSFPTPPDIVVLVMECVLTYFDAPKKDWATAKKYLGMSDFQEKLRDFKVEQCKKKTLDRVKKIIAKKEFNPDSIFKKAKAAACLAKWCIALVSYYEIRKKIKPQEDKLKMVEAELAEANERLAKSQAELKGARDKVKALQDKYDQTIDEKNRLADGIKENEKKLERASDLIDLTKDEGESWKETVEVLKNDRTKLIGDVFLGTSSISYIGPFTGVYRERILKEWINKLDEFNIPLSEKYKLTVTLGDPVKIRSWNMAGLPSDSVSIDNGIMCDRSERWPLMIDPQTQANQWIRNSFPDDLKIVKLSETDAYPKVLDRALRNGEIVLIEDVHEEIDPALDNILQKAIFDNNGLPTIHFGGKDIPYDDHFKLFMTSKLPNPHYLPEICIKMTIINFTVTFEGLEEQMLVDVVIHEKPSVEKKRDELIVKLANLESDKRDVEIKILKTLAESNEETILDGDELIHILQASKDKAVIIKDKLKEATEIEAEITETRNHYKQVSIRGSILYFVITDLAIIDPMYQYSLTYVKKLFNEAISESSKSDDLEERIEILINSITKSIYNNICRGLFENHKMIYSFLICTSIEKNKSEIDLPAWNFLLRGAGVYDAEGQPENPLPNIMNSEEWDLAYAFEKAYPEKLEGFYDSMLYTADHWKKFVESDDPTDTRIPCGFNEKLDSFEKLVILKIFRPESLGIAFNKYVSEKLGPYYSESPPSTMEGLYADSDKETPVIFVLSQGADPTNQLVKFAESKDYIDKFKYISLGQGQDKIATALIEQGKKEGNWVLLQNCHLFRSWMLELETMVNGFAEDPDINPDFRLFLTSMPVTYFPVSVLQNGLKLTTEPPKGIKANLKRSYNELTQNEFQHDKPEWNRLLFGLCFFHAIVQERRKFGPLGWNIRYQFNESDLETSRIMLRNFLNENETTPWDSMTFMTGQINYGGRVTDDLDRKLLLCILSKYYTPDILEDGYRFSKSGIYYAPQLSSLEDYRKFIDTLPANEDPEVFGMHENANLSFKISESASILSIILDIQPRMTGGGNGLTGDEIILNRIMDIQEKLPEIIDSND